MKHLVFLLSYVIVILILFAFNTTVTNKQLERTVHAQYTEKLTDASEKLTYLQRSVAQSLLFQNEKAVTTELDNIWRLSSEIRNSLAGLPIDKELSQQWMRYLGNIGDEAKATAISKDYDNWEKKMSNVSTNLRQLADDWAVATTVYYEQDGKLDKWQMDATDHKTSKQFTSVATTLKGYGESDFPLTASESDWEKKQNLQQLEDQNITEKEAMAKLQNLLPTVRKATIGISKSEKNAPYPFYHLQFHEGIRLGYADITQKGGHLLSFLVERPIDTSQLTQEQIVKKAKKYLQQMGYDDVVYVESRENHQAWHYTFARVHPKNKAIIYADAIHLKLAKDNGELLGLNAIEYIRKENVKANVQKPIQWDTFFAKDIQVEEQRLIYTENNYFEQRLCYEAIANKQGKNNESFRVVIDAETHEVLKVEYLT